MNNYLLFFIIASLAILGITVTLLVKRETFESEQFMNSTDCMVSDWKKDGKCSNNKQAFIRTVIKAPKKGGGKCPILRRVEDC